MVLAADKNRMQVSNHGLEGMARALERLQKTSERIARAGVPAQNAAADDVVDLSPELVAMLEARNAYEANLEMTRAANEMAARTLDLLA